MSGRPEEGIYGNLESQSSNVSQGDRRRARSEFESDTDYSSVSRRRLEEMHRPQWTMSSSVEDILLEGSTLKNNMKLNEFLRSNLGDEWVVERNGNVAMGNFVQDPETFIQNEGLLRIIKALPSYRELEAINKLDDEGVVFLEQWRDYKGKDTVTPHARGKLNGVLTQVQREEKREAEERLRRETEEMQRRAQEMKFTISTTIEDVLFKGRVRVKEKKLNDFLTMELDGRGIVDTNRGVLLKEFLKDPARYIHDEGVLREIKTTDAYLRMERAVKGEIIFENDQSKLYENGVSNLLGWSEAAPEVKANVHNFTKQTLDAALEEVRNPTTTIAPEKLEGLYESVYNARWHHVVEVSDGRGAGMKVEEGKPPQSWTYRAVGNTFEKNDGVEQSGAATPVLMVLTSDKGWPYSWNTMHGAGNDLCVNCEVERVWQIVKGDLTKWFSNFHLTLNPSPVRRLLIGTPGIGKSMNAGSYLLYQLLHYDVEKIQVVAHCFGSTMYVFEKTSRTVTKYEGNKTSKIVLGGLWQRGMKGYIIYDVGTNGTPPNAGFAPSKGWGMIVVSSPKVSNYDKWAAQINSLQIVMNCPEKDDVKAMCIWMKRGLEPTEQAEYWRMVEGRMDKVGPLLRYIFDQNVYKSRIDSCESTVNKMTLPQTSYYSVLGTDKMCEGSHVSHKLVKVVRVRGKADAELPYNALISSHLAELTLCKLAELMVPNDFNLLILAIKDDLISKALEDHSLFAFLSAAFVNAIIPKLTELKVERNAPPHRCALRVCPHERPFKPCLLECLENLKKKIKIECRVLYKPEAKNFPLVDGFFFVDSPRKTLVGLQMTTASAHHTIPSTVRQFNERMAEYFNGWEEFSEGLSWDIIYIQHADSTPMNGWQRCGPVNTENLSDDEKEIVAFWNEKVHQYQVSVSSGDF
ncbi:hypothetical protein ECC02_012321 [Trypanosoma cruzi]|uniref:Retrotransposon hot spot (RHS) protein n=1 Tax=Trypanosoma cruzi TaxID=5693 RepID=A0A7J6XKH8_TRYCR|nr:hypothetical protein ECC02_012321 [Trypanosoma cruzi]